MKKYFLHNPTLLVGYVIAAMIAAPLGMYFGFIMGDFVNLVQGGTMEQLMSTITVSMIWLVANIFFFWLYQYLKKLCLKSMKVALRKDLFAKIMQKDVPSFGQTSTGSYMAEMDANIRNLEANFFDPILQFVFRLTNLVAAFVSMLLIDITTGYMIGGLMVLCFLVPSMTKKIIQKRSTQYLGGVEAYTTHLKDYFQGFLVIRAFSLFPVIATQHHHYNEDMEYKKVAQENLHVILSCVSMFFGLMATIAAMGYGVYLVMTGRAEGGAIVTMGHLIGNVSSAFSTITAFVSQMNAAKPIIARFDAILQQETPKEGGKTLSYVEEMQFSDVTFSYGEGEPVLKDLSLSLEAGRSYAIVGESGSGKSTILSLLLRYYLAGQGNVMVNGEDIGNFGVSSYYNAMGTVSQNVFLFEDTLRNNITLYRSIPSEELEKAIALSRLSSFVASLPQGLDTMVSENGANFSAGERQRLALARMLVGNCQVLLLDEFTANLDAKTGNAIEEAILTLPDKMILHVTHKLQSQLLRQYDKIFVVHQGRIAEEGSYDQLMGEKGIFYSLQNLAQAVEQPQSV